MINISHILVLSQDSFLRRQVGAVLKGRLWGLFDSGTPDEAELD